MVTVRLFGMTKMLAGNQATLSLALPSGRRVKDLVAVIEAAYESAETGRTVTVKY